VRRAALCLLLAACPTVDVGDTPVAPPLCRPSLQAFKEPGGIWDVAIAPGDTAKSCISMTGCHGVATGRSSLRLIDKPRDQMSDSEWSLNLDSVARFLNCSTPSDSPFITKPEAGADPHLGGELWTCDSTCEPIVTVEAWINAR